MCCVYCITLCGLYHSSLIFKFLRSRCLWWWWFYQDWKSDERVSKNEQWSAAEPVAAEEGLADTASLVSGNRSKPSSTELIMSQQQQAFCSLEGVASTAEYER
ncbi:uncharacterized protein LOC126438166 [Schistocerca serialis cubense]|uniref:uncharacterized protein LOC126438166 n=1 Tax=Schistocerca serialis cubense TaxID=2023355 RepID=UPI00214E90AC|nr:uncharacterized protein LOC126438166 [Schistocerca serialis cubense]